MNVIKPLTGRGKEIQYEYLDFTIDVKWGSMKFKLSNTILDDILQNYFKDETKWYPLGASFDNPIKGGLGEYIQQNHKLTPRHASAIAAIMSKEKLIKNKGLRPVELKKGC